MTLASSVLTQLVADLSANRCDWRDNRHACPTLGERPLPSPQVIEKIVLQIQAALFPMYFGPSDLQREHEDFFVGHTLGQALNTLHEQIRLERACHGHISETDINAQLTQFAQTLPNIKTLLDSDVVAAYQGDPAALSVDEVILCYPSIIAMLHQRVAHALYTQGLPLIARMISNRAHQITGIDIHPGAQIGGSFFIDHGTGVVIGQTAIIGKRVRIYQAVTLGAKSFPKDEQGHPIKGIQRHPVVEDDVVIYAGATVLGRVTIGKGAVIGGNVWVTQDIAPGTVVTQAKASEG